MLISCGRCGYIWRVSGGGGTFCPQCYRPVHITLIVAIQQAERT
jgi:hypothetical protein